MVIAAPGASVELAWPGVEPGVLPHRLRRAGGAPGNQPATPTEDRRPGKIHRCLNSRGEIDASDRPGAGATSNWQIIQTGDFNGDGYSDILWRDVSSGMVAMRL
jgi:hypothetical protein